MSGYNDDQNLLFFPDTISELNTLRIQLALESMELPADEYLAANHVLVGLHRFFDSREGTEEIVMQLGYLSFLFEDFYERINK